MTTATVLIKKALQKILVQASEQPIESSEMSDAISELNDMMLELDADGIALGFTVITNPSDTITVPDGAIGGIASNLAIRLAPEYDEPISAGLFASAKSGMSAMRKLGVTIEQTSFGGTLPIGSGNEGDTFDDYHFYDEIPDSALTETNGNILLEDET